VRFITAVLSAALASALLGAGRPAMTQPSATTIIEAGRVIDAVSAAPIEDAAIEIRGGVIRRIGKRGSFPYSAGATRVALPGQTIIPGLFNVHLHIGKSASDEYSSGTGVAPIQRVANRELYYGVTHIMSLGLDGPEMDAFQAEQRAGRTTGAHVSFAGYGFAAKGGWAPKQLQSGDLHRPTTPAEAAAMVRQEEARGVDAIKIWEDDSHGELPKFSPEIYGAIIDEAHRRTRKVFTHMYALDDAKELIRRGLDVLAHSVRDREVDEEFLQLAKARHVTQVAGLVGHAADFTYAERPAFLDDPGLPRLYARTLLAMVGSPDYQKKIADNPGLAVVRREFAVAERNVAKVSAAGIPIAIGTDAGAPGNFHGLWDHREMEKLVTAGLTPMQALRAATIAGARVLGMDRQFGSLEPGKAADFVVLDADPLRDITNTRKIAAVWVGGRPVDRAALAK
jgi:imidazolonepropionase-like amidohydrolase